MSWKQLLAAGEVKPHKTSKKELDGIRQLVARDLADAAIAALSYDRRFATAYNGALQTAKIAIACAGYRVSSGTGHHKISFECTKLAVGAAADKYADYFEICRRKRNSIDYTSAQVATQTEAEEIVTKAGEFLALVEGWVAKDHPALKP